MKIGIRTPSLKKSIKARTTGKIKRKIKKSLIPGYGKKGMGILHPKKAIYNKVYNKTTVDVLKPIKTASKNKRNKSNKNNYEVYKDKQARHHRGYVLADLKINKTNYIICAFLGGIIGLQFLYAKQYYKASLCIITSWTLIPLVISLCDGIRTIFKQSDENGKITVQGYIKNK